MPLLSGLQHKSVSNSYTCVCLGDNSVCRPFPQTQVNQGFTSTINSPPLSAVYDVDLLSNSCINTYQLSNSCNGTAGRKVGYIRMSGPVKISSSINVEGWSNDSTQGTTMDSASTSDKPDASAPTDDNHPYGRFITVLFTTVPQTCRATQQTSPR